MLCASLGTVHAQYYSWGASPSSIKWRRLRTDSIKLIYPDYWQAGAHKALFLFDTIRPYISHGYSYGPARTPVIMQTQNMVSNGVVTYAPKRIELITFPGIDGFAEPWMKQLIAHEYRHSVQFNNINRSTIKAFSTIIGQQGTLIGSLLLPSWFMEGDAVMTETQMTTYGRALQPSFTMEYRAMGRINPRTWQIDRWFGGSYKYHIPDHYKMGYQMARWSRAHLGEDIWDEILKYSVDYPFFIVPRYIYLKRHYNITCAEIFRRTFGDLADMWDALPKVDDSARKIDTPIHSYTTYSHPQWLNDSTLVVLKEDLDNETAIYTIDLHSGRERLVRRIGRVSSRPALCGNRLYWTEYRQSTVWEERVNSQLCFYDFGCRQLQCSRSDYQVFLPTPTGNDALCYVTWDYSGGFAIRRGFDFEEQCYKFADDVEIKGLAWDDATRRLYFIALDQRGAWIGALREDWSGVEEITTPRFITISELRAQGGWLYFGSIVSGKDEAHAIELSSGTEYRLTTSTYGSFQPAPNRSGDMVAVTTYDSLGYKPALQRVESPTIQPYQELPTNLVNPPLERWDVINLDDINLAQVVDSARIAATPAKRYRKGLAGINLHSWAPLEMNPLTLMSSNDPDLNLGATVMSQNLLSSMVCYASWGWSRVMGSRYRIGFDYSGWGPKISFSGTYGGGNRMVYNRPVVGTELPASKRAIDLSMVISQPLWLATGHYMRRLTPSVGLKYTNDLFYEGTTARTGVCLLTGSLNYSEYARLAHRDFAPRWGYNVRMSLLANPFNHNFRTTLMTYAMGYMPGAAPHHSTQLQLAYQASLGNRSFGFRGKELFPRGAKYDFTPKRYLASSLEYQAPVAYPDWGIPSILFIRRIRVGAFIDFAQYQTFNTRWYQLFSYGGSVSFDVIPIRLPASSNTSITVTIAKPSDRKGVVAYASLGIPL